MKKSGNIQFEPYSLKKKPGGEREATPPSSPCLCRNSGDILQRNSTPSQQIKGQGLTKLSPLAGHVSKGGTKRRSGMPFAKEQCCNRWLRRSIVRSRCTSCDPNVDLVNYPQIKQDFSSYSKAGIFLN